MLSKLMFPRAIRYLLAVAEHQSFTRAADALYVSQPTLSQKSLPARSGLSDCTNTGSM